MNQIRYEFSTEEQAELFKFISEGAKEASESWLFTHKC